jgi:hypothetical protein
LSNTEALGSGLAQGSLVSILQQTSYSNPRCDTKLRPSAIFFGTFFSIARSDLSPYNFHMIKTRLLPAVLGSLFVLGGVAIAQLPKENISGKRHPNLAAAQRMSQNAYEKIVAAQQANEWDLQGHAQKAKELLDQVNRELKQAAEASNRRK